MGSVLLKVRDLKKHFPIHKGFFRSVVGHVKAVDGVSLEVRAGETLGVVGESGCGKTTLGRCILQLITPSAGEILYRFPDGRERDVTDLDVQASRLIKREIQVVFQDPYSSLNPSATIYKTMEEPLRMIGLKHRGEREDRIGELLEAVNLRPEFMFRYPHQFSGGQRQRIGIARALSVGPKMIVCDEPVSALDVSIQAQVLHLLKKLQSDYGLTYLFIAHDLSVVEYMSDRIAVMYLGKIVELTSPAHLFGKNKHPYTEALLSAIPIADPTRRRERDILKGETPNPADPPSGCRFHPRCPYAERICREKEPPAYRLSSDHMVACHLCAKSAPEEPSPTLESSA